MIMRKLNPESNTSKQFKLHVTIHNSDMADISAQKLNSYDTTFVCTYITADDDDLYRSQLLQAFRMTEWSDTVITKKTDVLFLVVENHFIEAFDLLRSKTTRFTHIMLMMGEHLTNENLFRVFFVYDIFQYAHRCFCDLVQIGNVTQKHKNQLLEAIRG